MNEQTRADLTAFLHGILLGAFAIALALSGALGVNALTLVLVVLVLIFILRYIAPGSISAYLIVGLLIGVVAVVAVPALSPALLAPVQLLLVLGVLWLMK
jgi:hypothetical protein